jgi:hypothetical protein
MGGKSSPPPPDYSGLEKVAQQQLDFSKEQYAEMKPFVTRLATTMADAQQQQMTQAQDYYDYSKSTFRPVEQGLVKQAQEFDTEAYRAQLAAKATADAAKAFQGAQGVSMREATRRGVNPASGAFGAASNANAMGLAAMQAGAANQARQQAEQLGWARKMDVTGLGRGLAGASTAAYSGATGAGQAAGGTMMSAGNQFQQGLQGAAGTMGTIVNSQTSAYNAGASQADPFAQIVGMGVGGYMSKFSDRRLKKNIELAGRDKRTGLNLYEFEYINGDGARYLGVMADEVELVMPQAVSVMDNGYKAVNYTMLGIEMQEVAHG